MITPIEDTALSIRFFRLQKLTELQEKSDHIIYITAEVLENLRRH